MSEILDEVRKNLIEEAVNSPNLLSDLAGLEKYIAESYSSRSFIELLQNADDACSERMMVKRYKKHILIANDGRIFTQQDFESLCRSASSRKEKKTNIGFRGIGFKSVVGFAERVHIFSGNLETTFSKELTSIEIPKATQVPLIRIPHSIDATLKADLLPQIKDLFDEGYKTIFIFSDLIADCVQSEFEELAPTAVLFLRNIRQVILETDIKTTITAYREKINKLTHQVRLADNGKSSTWNIFETDGVSIAIQENNNKEYVKLSENEAVVHAFLPTLEPTGFGLKVNGDISTDPSRLRVLFDENTLDTINRVAKLYVSLMEDCLSSNSEFGGRKTFEALMPFIDPRMVSLQKRSFRTEFMAAIKNASKGRFDNLYCKPNWLNSSDNEMLTKASNIRTVQRDICDINGLDAFLKFLGAKELTIGMYSQSLKKETITTHGAAEFVSQITKQYATKQITTEMIDPEWKIWSIGNEIKSLPEAIRTNNCLDSDFVDMVTEQIGISSELPRLLSKMTDKETAEVLVHQNTDKDFSEKEIAQNSPVKIPHVQLSLTKWRSVEQQVFEILSAEGWNSKDVSLQNIGYDIEATNANGNVVFVEVKSLNYAGQNFILTSNEEATAREKGESYILALVLQKQDRLDVMFIENPIKYLQFERQCRQWVWLCPSYEFKPSAYHYRQ